MYKITVQGDREHLEETLELIHFVALQCGAIKSVADVIAAAVGEACQNAVQHGSEGYFTLELHLKHEILTAVIVNKGDAVNFDSVQTFNVGQDFLQYSEGGLGIPLMKKLMDDVQYERRGNQNVFTLVKSLTSKLRRKDEHHQDQGDGPR